MTEQSQGRGRSAEQQYRSKAPRIPRIPEPSKAQLPFTLVALVVILLCVAAAWFAFR